MKEIEFLTLEDMKQMKLIKQPKGSSLCGQCCLAMILQISLEEAIQLIGHKNETKEWELLKHLPDINEVYSFIGEPTKQHKKLYLLQLHKNPKNSKQRHWTISSINGILDPAEIGENIWPVYKYWIV